MSDKKEIATLSIKISVDSTDLDKLEAQLKRIKELMVSAGLKQQAKQGFTMDFGKGYLEPVFTVSHGVAYVNDTCIEKATLEKVMLQAAKEGAKKVADQARSEITTGINDNREQVSAEMLLKSSAEIAETSKVISSEQSTTQQLSDLQHQITELGKEIEEAKLKGSLNAIDIISIKQTMEQQEKSLAETIKRMIVEDLCRGGTLSRML